MKPPLDGTTGGRAPSPATQRASAPASGEGIYYAMVGGRLAATAGEEFLTTSGTRVR